jgi:hypothetical protein
VNSPAISSTASFLGGGPTTYPTDGTALFGDANTLILSSPIHLLCYIAGSQNGSCNEWVDNVASYSDAGGFVYQPETDGATSDRRINLNAVYPVAGQIQKGLRVTECVDQNTAPGTANASLLGNTGLGSPNGPDDSVVNTKRIVDKVDALIAAGAPRQLMYSTFVNGAWTTPVPTTRDFLISKLIQWVVGHEIGHAVQLTPTVMGTQKTSYGYHFAPFTGDMLDQTVTTKIDTKTTGFNTFYIPSAFSSTDQSSFRLK